MSAPVSPRAADTIRKITAYLIAGFGTWFLLRFLYRLANGEASWTDADLWRFLALAVLMTIWVVAARPVRRRASSQDRETQEPPQTS